MIDIFIPSYHRADNIKTAKYFVKIGWNPKNIHVVVDDEADDIEAYEFNCDKLGVNLHIISQEEARRTYDYVHRPSESRRSAGQSRNMFYEIAERLDIKFYCVQDDDTSGYQIKRKGKYKGMASFDDITLFFEAIKEFMLRRRIGCFGASQTGDFIGGTNKKLLRNKVMNTTFYNTPFIYKGERGVQDDDTSQFVGIMNEGLFTGSAGDGIVLNQTPSATAKGGLTELYNECKLLNKSLVCPIQFPSAIYADSQTKNGGRIHHKIISKYLYPRLIKTVGVNNIRWDTYPEDAPFTNENLTNKDVV